MIRYISLVLKKTNEFMEGLYVFEGVRMAKMGFAYPYTRN